jgi:RimJ/RimL family protein N-acetyltransferase
MNVPREIETDRLVLRPWTAGDAAALHPILEVNWDHLGPWIPARVATPAPVEILAERLADFAAEFGRAREWRYAMLVRADGKLLGEISLFPRSSSSRVPFGESDRVEIGYWLRIDETGRGLMTEAVQASIEIVRKIVRFDCVEIRCDSRNRASSAIPQRLGFTLTQTIIDPKEPDVHLQVWTLPL